MKTTKDNVFEYIQKETMTNPEYKDGISTSAVAGYFGFCSERVGKRGASC